MSESEENPAAPDSTTKEQRLGFCEDQDVFLHKNGKYYLGTVCEVDQARERCLIKFMDNTSSWSSFKDLTKHAMPESDVMCVLCKKSQPKTDNKIVVCDKCGRGYHQLCHQPRISKGQCTPEASWKCKKCYDSQQPRVRESDIAEPKNSMVKANIRKVCSGRDQPPPPPDDRTKLPYKPELLDWDAYHRVNKEQIYCYCGLNGEWYTQMLQCARCRQWFHEKCVSCLKHPLYSGDRFYVFVCSVCNYGKEFVRRLELKWVDLVHLMLYNLTVYNAKKYYDLDSVIVPYANENWINLQLPPRIRHVTPRVRRDVILSILTNNRNRFKCGREIKKRTTIWGLRTRLPPPSPVVPLPPTVPIDDAVLHRVCSTNKRLHYLLPDGESSLEVDSTNQDNAEQEQIIKEVKVESTIDSSEMAMRGVSEMDSTADQTSCSTSSQSINQSLRERYSGGGFVKKSFPFPKHCFQKRKRLMALVNCRERMLRNYKMRERGPFDSSVAARLQGAREARFRKARKLQIKSKTKNEAEEVEDEEDDEDEEDEEEEDEEEEDEEEEDEDEEENEEPIEVNEMVDPLQIKSEMDCVENLETVAETADLPPTPPTSVSGPPTPPATVSAMSEISMSSSVEMTHILPPSTPADTSGDETSSRGTLDSFIPPPKDFEGKNNPFRNLSELLGAPCGSGQASSSSSSTSNPSPITLPLPLTPVIYGYYPPPIPRPAKRQLSEKDIIIDRNGQVKRRRTHRRGRPPSQHYTVSKTAAIVPPRSNEVNKGELMRNLRSSYSSSSSNHIDDIDFQLNRRRLRQRQSSEKPSQIETPSQQTSEPPSPKCSPIKQNTPEISMNKLKSSVNIYFGAANRIASGEKFTIKGKRLSSNGQVQYLIEWDGLNP